MKKLARRTFSLLVAFAMLITTIPCLDMIEWFNKNATMVVYAARAEGQTQSFSSLNEFIEYTYDIHNESNSETTGYQGHQCDTINITVTSGEIYQICNTSNGKSFYPLGSVDYPFAGTLQISAGGSATTQLNLQSSLFDYVYDTAKIIDTTGNFLELSLSRAEGGYGVLFANHVVDDPEDANNTKATANKWMLKTVCYENMAYGESGYMEYENVSFSGLIDTIESGAIVNLEVVNNNALTHSTGFTSVTASGNAGLLCDTLNGTLNVNAISGTNTSYSITASNGSAGGLVGAMGSGSVLNLNYTGTFGLDDTNSVDPSITATANVGGLVGSVNGGKINISSGKFTIDSYTLESSGTSTYAGGLIGSYTNNNNNNSTITTEIFDFTTNWNVTNCDIQADMTGGVIGHYTNNIATATVTNSTTSTLSTSCSTGTAGETYYHGGIIGQYDCDSLTRSLVFDNAGVSFTCPLDTVKAGAIAFVGSTSYVKASDLTVNMTVSNNTHAGGVIGVVSDTCDCMLDFGTVTVTSNDLAAGLVQSLNTSVLRLSGTTNLSAAKALPGSTNYGQLVGKRTRGLVYALGTGADATPSYGSGWSFIRSTTATNADDIGSWGEVLRPDGTKISLVGLESSNGANTGILDYNSTAHTVRVAAPAYADDKYTIANAAAFTKLALNYQINTESSYSGAITFETNGLSSTIAGRDIDITDNINLSDIGITGFTRDNNEGSSYTGALTGNNKTVTLAIGEAYGIRNGSELTTDGVQGSGKIYRHSRLGLFNSINAATVSNITIAGSVNAEFTLSAYAGGLAAYASGAFLVTSLTATEGLNIKHSAGDNVVRVGGIIGNVGNDNASTSASISSSTSNLTASLDITEAGRIFSYGGYIGYIDDSNATYTFTSDTISGSVSSASAFTNMHAGGLVGDTASQKTSTDLRNLVINGVTVQNYTQTNNATKTAGGVLGYSWPNTNVTFTDLDVSATTTLSMTGNSDAYSHEFAGLVYRATGYWKVDDIDLNALTVTDSGYTTSFGLLVNKGTNVDSVKSGIYLELTSTSAYTISSSNVSITLGSKRASDLIFDEFVAFSSDYTTRDITEKNDKNEDVTIGTMPENTNVMNNSQGVVSIRTSGDAINMSSGNCNTYQNVTKNGGSTEWPVNKYTRYYYNLDYISGIYAQELAAAAEEGEEEEEENNVAASDGQKLLLWSVNTYAAANIKNKFANPYSSDGISGTDFDMVGLSYYPVNWEDSSVSIGDMGNIKFYNSEIETREKYTHSTNSAYDNHLRVTSGADQSHTQHYMMHCGLFRNVTADMTIDGDLSFAGNIGKVNNGSGALICGTILGDSDAQIRTNYSNASKTIELRGIYVNSSTAWSDYAPLLVNQVGSYTNFTLYGVFTPKDDENDVFYYNRDDARSGQAATSLVGNAGNSNISIVFSKIKLDSRTTDYEYSSNSTYLSDLTDEYNTDYSIFTKSTLLNQFAYNSTGNCTGSYNYTWNEDWGTGNRNVTYGYEVSESVEHQDSNGDSEENCYLGDARYTDPYSDDASSEFDFSYGILPYVYQGYVADTYHELAVNLASADIEEGCGTYNDPYVISTPKQLETIAKLIEGTMPADGFVINYPSTAALSNGWCTATTSGETTTYDHITYTYLSDIDGFYSDASTPSGQLATATLRQHLAGAYYMITEDLDLSSSFVGMGASMGDDNKQYAFRGIIVGKGTTETVNGEEVTTYPTVTNRSIYPFVKTSNGSVVKNLSITVDGLYLNPGNTSTFTYGYGELKSYGAVMGQIMGGDNIIDNVQVAFSDDCEICLNGSFDQLYPVGGYVGTIVCGGLFFRHMSGDIDGLGADSTIVNDGAGNDDLVSSDNMKWLYVNSIIGRVLNGYAVTETTKYRPFEDGTRTFPDGSKTYWNDTAFIELKASSANFASLDESYTATAKGVTMRNSTKNYSIADIIKPSDDSTKLDVSKLFKTNTKHVGTTITFPNAQSMLVLSMLTQSNCTNSYRGGNELYQKYSYQCRYGINPYGNNEYKTTHMADYDEVGPVTDTGITSSYADFNESLLDDYYVHDGDNQAGAEATTLVPYLVKYYTTQKGDYNTGYGVFNVSCHATLCNIAFGGLGNETWYIPDGFRGIGSLSLGVSNNATNPASDMCIGIYDFAGKGNTFSLNMAYNYYNDEFENYKVCNGSSAANYGFGLFNEINANITGRKIDNNGTYTTEDNNKVYTIHDFKLSGNVSSIAYSSSDGREFASNNAAAYNGNNKGLSKNSYNAVGAFAGTTNSREANKFVFDNIELKDVCVRGTKYAGGLIGYAFQNNNIYSEMIINNISSSSLDVSSAVSSGGLIGYTNSTKITINGDYNNTGTNTAFGIKNVYNIASFNNSDALTVGGLIGTVIAGNATKQIKISNIDITGSNNNTADIGLMTSSNAANNASRVGGFIGCSGETQLIVDNCNVKRTNINGGQVGGYVGYIYYDIKNTSAVTHTITNSSLDADDKTVKIEGARNVGGIFGYNYSKENTGSNITVDLFEIRNYVLENVLTGNGKDNYRNVGGVGGYFRQDGTSSISLNLRNISIKNSTVKSNYTSENDSGRQGTGLLMGCISANNVSYSRVYGYNILLEGNSLDRYTTSSFKNPSANTLIGNNYNELPVKLVGVSIQGGTIPTTRLVGKYKQNNTTEYLGNSGYVILADYNGDSVSTTSSSPNKIFSFAGDDNNVKDYNGADVIDNYPYVTSSGYQMIDGTHFLTGDGVVYDIAATKNVTWSDGGENVSVALMDSAFANICQDIITGTKTTRYKRTLTAAEVEAWLNTYGDKLTTYNTAMGLTGTENALSVDFPILLADDNTPATLTNMINGYLQIVTDSPTTEYFSQYNTTKNSAKNYKVEISTIRLNGSSFEEVTTDGWTPALYTTNGQYFTFSNNNVDSSPENVQFSLIDVQYYDPSSSSDEVAYHVYVPVLVKKMLKYSFKASPLSGTEYRSENYEDKYNVPLIDSFGSPITVYATWTIGQDEIQSLIDGGDSLLWNYEKNATLAYAAVNGSTVYLPSGTKVALVDPNNNKDSVFYGELASGASSIVFGNLHSDYYTEAEPNNAFTPQTLSEIGSYTVLKYDSSSSTNRYIKDGTVYYKDGVNYTFDITDDHTELSGDDGSRDTDDTHPGTIKIGDDYYRLYDSSTDQNPDDAVSGYNTYFITVDDDINENYYINFFTPFVSSFAHITLSSPNQLTGNVLSQRTNAIPAHFYLGDIYTQTLTFHTGTRGENNDQIMNQENTSISVYAQTEIELKDLYRNEVKDVLAASDEIDLYHSFSVYLTTIPENKREIAGNPSINGSYTFASTSAENTVENISGSATSPNFIEIKPTLVHSIKNDLLYDNAANRTADEEGGTNTYANGLGKATITAQITIRYDVSGILAQFPEGDGSGDTGVEASVKSNLAYSYNDTAYSSISESTGDSYHKIYYRLAMDEATLKYNVPLSTSSNRLDGSVSQLGINAFNEEELGKDTTPDIDTIGYYNIYNLPDLEDADKVVWTLEIHAKQENGSYGDALPIYEYLDPTAGITMKAVGNGTESTVVYGKVINSSGNVVRSNTITNNSQIYGLVYEDDFSDYYYDGMGIQVKLNYGVVTDTADFTTSGTKFYANYEVILRASLYDADGELIKGSGARDHIIYTNAKVNPNFIDTE